MNGEADKIRRRAMLLAKYQEAKDRVLKLYDTVNWAEAEQYRLRRQLVAMFGEGELMDIMEEEPTNVFNPSGQGNSNV
ncbi:MAG: hypothetical protein ABWY82_00740 [Tardiphaga sp.]